MRDSSSHLAPAKNIYVESTASKKTGVSDGKEHKSSVPTFDGRVLNWKNFWEQFYVTINSKTA